MTSNELDTRFGVYVVMAGIVMSAIIGTVGWAQAQEARRWREYTEEHRCKLAPGEVERGLYGRTIWDCDGFQVIHR